MDLLEFVRNCTFDDFLFTPQRGVLARRDPAVVDLSSRFSEHLMLKRPIVSANMDTVTRAPMAIVQAEEGGIGIIDRGFRPGEIDPQVREVEAVKRSQHGVIRDPWSIRAEASLEDAAALMARTRVGTLVVVDEAGRLMGLLTERDMRFVSRGGSRVSDRMTPRARLVVHEGPIEPDAAERLMVEKKIKKLPLVTKDGRLMGLITARDLLRQRRMPFATRDSQGRLRVGAAIGATGDYLERAGELLRADVDVIVIAALMASRWVLDRAAAVRPG
jgi:IMP dehydrogenase